MGSLKIIRKRIGSVKNTQKVTKAMKLVAAAKLRRAQRRALASRAFADKLIEMTTRVAAGSEHLPPLMQSREMKRIDLILLTSDRGLCGGFNENLMRAMKTYIKEEEQKGKEVTVTMIGRKGRDALRRFQRQGTIEMKDALPENNPETFSHLIAEQMRERFLNGMSDGAVLVYNRFFSAGRQKVVFEKLLPFSEQSEKQKSTSVLIEPSPTDVLEALVNEALFGHVNQALLDSKASELASRMMAMDNATKNASEMIEMLTLQYNRARQATITGELLDIVGGSEALN